jgi:DNA-binding NarL/FixJ family response regulator
MVKVCILTESPTYRAGIAALLREGEGLGVQVFAPDVVDSAEPTVVYIVFFDELDTYRARIIDKIVVLVINRKEKGNWFLQDHDNGWGLLPYDASAEDLIAIIVAVSRGMVVLPVEELRRVMTIDDSGGGAEREIVGMVENLTNREMDIMQLLGQGYQNKHIALSLGISENTVKFHVSSIFTKLGVSNRTEALRAGNKYGLIGL